MMNSVKALLIDGRKQCRAFGIALSVIPCLFMLSGILLMDGCGGKKTAPAPTPPDVAVAPVVQKDVPITGTWVATLEGYVNASIQPQVSGYIVKQLYREGSVVHQGDVLYQIDPRPLRAVLDQAQAQLAQARGQVAQATAQLGLANINVKRDTPLAAARAIAQSQLDNDIQTRATDEAMLQTDKAAVQASQASLEQAGLNLGFTKVRSLIDGVAGIATVQLGNLVSPTTVLTTISRVNPIKVYFSISEQEYLEMTSKIKSGAAVDLLGSKNSVPLQLTLSNGKAWPHKGQIVFVNRQVDQQTGTIQIVGAFSNPGDVLRPGMFGNVSAVTTVEKDALLVPQSAVSQLQGSYQVAVVGPDNKVAIRDVNVGTRDGTLWVITSGLKPGERVVTQGTTKVKTGMTVHPTLDNTQAGGE